MLAAERHSKIVDIVNRAGVVSVEELSQQLQVSAMTIRRDLDKLNRMGRLDRCHGGAVPLSAIRSEENYDQKMVSNHDAKMNIARICANFIKPGDSVFLDSGTTTFEIAMLIKETQDITIITNDVKIACALLSSPAKIILCGGIAQNVTGTVLGQMAEDMLRNFRVTTSFIGTSCVDEEFNITTPTLEKSFLKRAAIEIANTAYLAVDASKFYHHALVRITNMSSFTGVVTDKVFSAGERKTLKSKNIEIIETHKYF